MYDLAIIGGGPAGVAAAVYAARKQLKTVFIAEVVGGQSVDSMDIQNWIGTPHIAGPDLAQSLEKHLREYAGEIVDLKIGERAESIVGSFGNFTVKTSAGEYQAKTILVASGGARRKLEVPGALEYEHKGLTYCASCDGPIFAGQDTVVIGGGNAGFETAAQLLAYAKSVTLLSRSEHKADPVTVEKVLAHPNMKAYTHVEPVKVVGEKFVTSLVFKGKDGVEVTLPAGGVFVEIGMVPSTDYVKGLIELDALGRVVTNPKNQQARLIQTPEMGSDARRGESADQDAGMSAAREARGTRNAADELISGVWAAGDCTDELYHQNNIAAGDGVKALEDIYMHLKAR